MAQGARGRPSNLTEKQWAEILQRILAGEKICNIAKEYNISQQRICTKFGKRKEEIKSVANQIVSAEAKLKQLPYSEQLATMSLVDELRAISMHLASAAKFGSATAHRLSGIAHAKVQEISDTDPLSGDSLESLKGVSTLTRLANDASTIGMNLLAANKDMLKEQSGGALPSALPIKIDDFV